MHLSRTRVILMTKAAQSLRLRTLTQGRSKRSPIVLEIGSGGLVNQGELSSTPRQTLCVQRTQHQEGDWGA